MKDQLITKRNTKEAWKKCNQGLTNCSHAIFGRYCHENIVDVLTTLNLILFLCVGLCIAILLLISPYMFYQCYNTHVESCPFVYNNDTGLYDITYENQQRSVSSINFIFCGDGLITDSPGVIFPKAGPCALFYVGFIVDSVILLFFIIIGIIYLFYQLFHKFMQLSCVHKYCCCVSPIDEDEMEQMMKSV